MLWNERKKLDIKPPEGKQKAQVVSSKHMALEPGILTDWPWKSLGNFKYLILAPWAVHATYSYMVKEEKERDIGLFFIFPFLLLRILHNQIWISISRHQTANKRIVDKGIEFDQVDRESNWDDQIIMTGIISYVVYMACPGASHLPIWRTDSVIFVALLHAGPVEFLYYWSHRALHHHFLYSRYHSHHHSSIATQPITSVVHPFAETMVYIMLFAIPELTLLLSGTTSLVAVFGYLFYIDFMNNLGHCNFEFIPRRLFSVFPPLKFLMYTPSFHSLHHTQFRTNYSLFMPFYDYIYNTMDKSSDMVHESSLKKPKETPDVVHLTHLTTPQSIFHLRLVSSSFSARPQSPSSTSLWYMWPLTFWFMMSTWFYDHTITVQKNTFKKLVLQTWLLPNYKIQYDLKWKATAVNESIEKSILEADKRGAKVVSLGLLNQGEELYRYGELYIEKNPKLKVKLVDGSSLAAAVVVNSIPQGTTQVLLVGNLTKVAKAITSTLCHRGILVNVLSKEAYKELKCQSNPVLATSYDHKTWLVGDGVPDEEQLKAPKGTLFIPFIQFPPKRVRKDCLYHTTPALLAPKSLRNLDSCEDWLPRRVLSAWRIAGIVHALEEWNVDECGGEGIFNIDQVWEATLRHGFRPLSPSHT